MRTEGLAGDPDYASYATRPLQSSGLIGPVRLILYSKVVDGSAGGAVSRSAGAREPAG